MGKGVANPPKVAVIALGDLPKTRRVGCSARSTELRFGLAWCPPQIL